MLDALFAVDLMHLAVDVGNSPKLFVAAIETLPIRVVWVFHDFTRHVDAELAAWSEQTVRAETDTPVQQASEVVLLIVADNVQLVLVLGKMTQERAACWPGADNANRWF